MSASDPTSSVPGGRVRLDVVARDRAAQIVVIDSSLAPVARGVSTVSVDLAPGIYKARVITGAQVREQFAVLTADRGPVQLEFPLIAFASPAPLDKTTKTHEYHMAAAHQHSLQVHVDLGGNSQIFLFLRDYTKPGKAPLAAADLAAGVELTDMDGRTVVSFEGHGAHETRGDSWYACNVALEPGIYRLVVDMGEERLAQTVVASANWQTQVFLLREATGQGRKRSSLNMSGASMFLVRTKQGFHPSENELRVIELARQGLTNRRQIVSRADMDILISGKFENPMLGLFAAHLLLLSRKPEDEPLLKTIVGNLQAMLGEHPDVDALALAIGTLGPQKRFSHPPMLAPSYWLVIEQSARRPELVPARSITAEIATRLWGGSGAWLVYNEPAPRFMTLESFSRPAGQQPSMEELLEQLHHHDLRRLASNRMVLTTTEEAVVRYLTPPDKRRLSLRSLSNESAPTHGFDEKQMVRALGLPPAVLREAIRSVLSKAQQLGQQGQSRHAPAWQGRWAAAYSKGGSSAGDPSFPLGVGRLERAVLRCSRWQDKARAWAAVERLEPQVKDAFLSRESFKRMEQCLPRWRDQWVEVRSELETPSSLARLASELPSRMATSHTDVGSLLSASKPGTRFEHEPRLSLWEAYDVLESLLRRCRRELPLAAMQGRDVKKAEKTRLTNALHTALLGIKAMSAGLRMGEAGASTFWLGSRAVQSIKEQFFEQRPARPSSRSVT